MGSWFYGFSARTDFGQNCHFGENYWWTRIPLEQRLIRAENICCVNLGSCLGKGFGNTRRLQPIVCPGRGGVKLRGGVKQNIKQGSGPLLLTQQVSAKQMINFYLVSLSAFLVETYPNPTFLQTKQTVTIICAVGYFHPRYSLPRSLTAAAAQLQFLAD